MSFTIITTSTETSEIGPNYPQVDGLIKGYNYDAENSILNISKLEEDPNFKINVQNFILKKSTKVTDFLSFNPEFFLVSQRTYDILKKYRLPPSVIFKTKVEHDNKKYDYYIIFFLNNKYDFIDYSKSRFTLRYFNKKEKDNYIFKTKENFNKEAEEAYQVLPRILYAKDSSRITYDIFKVNYYHQDYFISNKLKTEFIEAGITGINYLENINTIFHPKEKKYIEEKNKLVSRHFLLRTGYYSNGKVIRNFNKNTNVVEEYNNKGIKTRELLFSKGNFKGSERSFYPNGKVKIEKIVKSNTIVVFRYYFQNEQLNYEITYDEKKGIFCDKVFDINGQHLKKYYLKNGSGTIFHLIGNGKGGRLLTFKNHTFVKEKKINQSQDHQ